MKIHVIIVLQTCGILLFAFILSYNLILAKRKLGTAYMAQFAIITDTLDKGR